MHKRKLGFVFLYLVISTSSTAQDVGFAPRAAVADMGFFDMLAAMFHTSERPLSFEQTVDMSSVIATGYFSEILPGRTITNKRVPLLPPRETIVLKIAALNVLKGDSEPFYYVEYPVGQMMIGQLRERLYTGELLFLLRPAHPGYSEEDAEISVSREAGAALGEQPLYEFTLSSSVFIISPDDRLTTPLGTSTQLDDLYTTVTSLAELETRIVALLSDD